MPVSPLFVADMKTLKKRLRLSGISQAGDGQAILEKAVEDVRIYFFDDEKGLGESRVLALRAIAFVENALTAAELERTRANNLEVMWVRLLLLRRMPTLFHDGGGVSHEMWNEEPLTRLSLGDLQDEIKRLEGEILEELQDLSGGDAPTSIDILVIEPEVTPELPGDSIKPILLKGT